MIRPFEKTYASFFNGFTKKILISNETIYKSQGMKQLMAGGGVALIGTTLVPLLAGLF